MSTAASLIPEELQRHFFDVQGWDDRRSTPGNRRYWTATTAYFCLVAVALMLVDARLTNEPRYPGQILDPSLLVNPGSLEGVVANTVVATVSLILWGVLSWRRMCARRAERKRISLTVNNAYRDWFRALKNVLERSGVGDLDPELTVEDREDLGSPDLELPLITPDGRRIMVKRRIINDHEVALWDVATNRPLKSAVQGHTPTQ